MISVVHRWREFSRSVVSQYCAGLAILSLVLSGLLVQLGIDWKAVALGSIRSSTANVAALESLRHSTVALRGAGDRLAGTKAAIDAFYAGRVPLSYSQISTHITQIGAASGVQLSHVNYDQKASGYSLTEISIESDVSGTYPQIMRFINGLERDRAFFVIRAMTITGQQGGEVNLQLRFSTWLRKADGTTREFASAAIDHATATLAKEIE